MANPFENIKDKIGDIGDAVRNKVPFGNRDSDDYDEEDEYEADEDEGDDDEEDPADDGSEDTDDDSYGYSGDDEEDEDEDTEEDDDSGRQRTRRHNRRNKNDYIPDITESYIRDEADKKKGISHKTYHIVSTIIILSVVIGCFSYLARLYSRRDDPVTSDDLEITYTDYGKKTYAVSYEVSDKINGTQYVDMKAGAASIHIPQSVFYNVVSDNDKRTTAIYLLTIRNKSNYLGKFMNPDIINVTRFSCMGDKPFTAKEIKKYEKIALVLLDENKRKSTSMTKLTEEELGTMNNDANISLQKSSMFAFLQPKKNRNYGGDKKYIDPDTCEEIKDDSNNEKSGR